MRRAEVVAADRSVHVALAHPDVHVRATGLALHVRTEELVGEEEDLTIGGDGVDDVDGVRRRAADVGLGLHRGRGVDVRHDDGTGVLGLPLAQLVGGDGVGERAAGVGVGDQHRAVRREQLGRLGHEVDAAQHDRRRSARRGQPGQLQRVAHVVSDLLDLRHLVVVGQDQRVPLGGETAYLLGVGRVDHGRAQPRHTSVVWGLVAS